MTLLTLIADGTRYHWRLYQGLIIGTIIASAVLTGALVVGDSVKQTLRDIAEVRLGEIGYALNWGNRYFSVELEQDMNVAVSSDSTEECYWALAAVLALRGVAEPPPDRAADANRLNRAWVYGVNSNFWLLATDDETPAAPGPQEALINEETARVLGLQPGDDMVLRLARPSTIPLEAPLSQDDESNTAVARVRVKAVLTETQLGRFSLATDQAVPANIFLDREWLSELVGLQGKTNLLLAAKYVEEETLEDYLSMVWRPEYAGFQSRTHLSGIVQLESDRLFIEEPVVKATENLGNAQPTLTYLVNSISTDAHTTPYSFVTAGTAPLDTPEGSVCVNQWLADALEVKPGDTVDIAWYEPMPSGEFEERARKRQYMQSSPWRHFKLNGTWHCNFPA
jgi:putative ABC transport system permease protein